MKKRHALPRLLTAFALAACVPLAACGDDDEEEGSGGGSEATPVAFELKPAGKRPTLEGPASVKGGLADITLKNSTEKDGSLQLLRIEGDHTAKEALAAGNAWGERGRPLPEWVLLPGGTGSTKGGTSITVTSTLPPGKYLAVDLDSNAFQDFEVTEGGGGEPSAPSARVDAVEYAFASTGLKAGKSEVLFDNKGKEPHFIAGTPIKRGKTIEDVKTFFRTEKGEPPIDESEGFSTAVIDGGVKQVVELDLKKGSYAFLCFVPDRKGGPPHVVKGMISEAVVE